MYIWKAEMQWNGLYKEKNPTKRRDQHFTREKREREREIMASFCKHITLVY